MRRDPLLIIGQGLAGSLLAWELARLGADIRVASDPAGGGAWQAAAGLISPITGRRLALADGAGEYFPAAQELYDELERSLGRRFLHRLPIQRLLFDPEQVASWQKRRSLVAYRGWFDEPGLSVDALRALLRQRPLESITLRHTGWLDLPALIRAIRQWLEVRGALIPRRIDPARIEVRPEGVHCEGRRFERVLFCEGLDARTNPWLDRRLRFEPVSGDVLEIQSEKEIPPAWSGRIVNWGSWLIPLGNGRFRAGATHRRMDEPAAGLSGGKREVEKAVQSLLDLSFTTTAHRWGIRPILAQRLPCVQTLPGQPRIGLFNGLGSRGTLLAPYWARALARHLILGEALPEAVNRLQIE